MKHTKRPPWLTAERAIDLLLAEHEPQINELVAVSNDSYEWRDPDLDDRAEDLELWCNGCHRSADRCAVMPILALVLDPWTQRLKNRVRDLMNTALHRTPDNEGAPNA